ncbi:hypothetical protein BGZ93_008937 [Podila epicladia]|nr:hypothetical protein BGZ93_008937 [Podila epicladia]
MTKDGFFVLSTHQQQQPQPQQQHTPQISLHIPEQNPTSSQHPQQQQLPEFPQGEDVQAKNMTLSSRIGSTGSQLISPIHEVRKRTGRRVLHRPRPLDLNHDSLHGKRSSQSYSGPHSQYTLSGSTSEARTPGSTMLGQGSSTSGPTSAVGAGLGHLGASTTKEPKHKGPQHPALQIKTDLEPPGHRRSSAPSSNVFNTSTANNETSTNIHEPSKRTPSKWQIGLERLLKKLQRRKRAPSNLRWYADHSTESYLSGATMETSKSKAARSETDAEVENLYFGHDKPPKWVVDVLSQEQELFYSDDTVDLVQNLRDYLILATESGWDITELKEDVTAATTKAIFPHRRHRSTSPHGHGPGHVTSPMGSAPITASPLSPAGALDDSPTSSRRDSKGSIDFDYFQHTAGRYVEEEDTSLRLLDFFMSILSDVISHDCRYKVQHPRPSRPEWILHSLVLDVLFYLTRTMIQDHKSIYDIGMIALSAFPVFKNNSLVRLLDLLIGLILPSFALSRVQPAPFIFTSPPVSPTTTGPMSPSAIRVQLQNNTTFAIQVHSPTEENGMLSVPSHNRPSLTSPKIPSTRTSSYSRPGPITHVQDTLDTHAGSLISLTLLSVLQQISFSLSPLAVAKKLEESIGGLLRIKPDLSADLLEVIAIVENEKVMRRALEVLWWIGKPTFGHLVLGEKFFPLDYDSIVQMRQTRHDWVNASNNDAINLNARSNTSKSEALFSTFRRGSLDDSVLPKMSSTVRNYTSSSMKSRSKYRPTLPWKTARASGVAPVAPTQQQQAQSGIGLDYLADHELYPFMFPTQEDTPKAGDAADMSRNRYCERCELIMQGYGLHCYHCRESIHLECFYSVKRFAGVDCTLPGAALDVVSRQPKNQLLYPDESDVFEAPTNKTFRIRTGHHLQLVNLFSTCLCAACKLPLWGHHHQAYRCQDCSQLMHLDCKGTALINCGTTQPLALKNLFPTTISYDDLRQSFVVYYSSLIKTLEALQSSQSSSGSGSLSSPSSLSSSGHIKDKYSYEEASCNASVLTLQLELLQAGLERGDIQVQEWSQASMSNPDINPMTTSNFELITLQKYFDDLAETLREPGQSTAQTLFLSDFFEDSKPDQFLLFVEGYWSHFAAIAKTMILDTDTALLNFKQQQFFSHAQDTTDGVLDEEDIFTVGLDTMQEELLAGHSVQSCNVSLATVFRFCMGRLGFQSSWTMQVVLQEWVKLGLLERLDGELCLFEPALPGPQTPGLSPNLVTKGSDRKLDIVIPSVRTSYFDDGPSLMRANSSASTMLGIRSVPCMFPFVTAIDPSSQVENLIHAIWRCLSSVDLSVNECGFLLLNRQCWPDPFMSDYTAERLIGCVFHWLLLEDDQLFVIHKTFSSKGKRIPGVRHGLDEQIARKVIVLSEGTNTPVGSSGAHIGSLNGTSERESGVGTGTLGSGGTSASMSAFMAATAVTASDTHTAGTTSANPLSSTLISAPTLTSFNGRISSMASNHVGEVGSFVRARRLMANKFAIPWLKKIMDLDPDRYLEVVYRQIRILEREMATEEDDQGDTEKERQKFRYAQAERYLDAITKLRQAGFLFSSFSKVLCHWLDEVEQMLDGMDITSRNFKSLHRLFLKANQPNGGRHGSGLGSGGVGPGSGVSTPTGGAKLEGEWRARLRAKLHDHKHQGSKTHSLALDNPPDLSSGEFSDAAGKVDNTESPLGSLRSMFASPDGQGIKRAFYWLDLMVQSKVYLPATAFVACCERLTEMSQSPDMIAMEQPGSSTLQQMTTVQGLQLLDLSKHFLKSCWEYTVNSSHRMTEVETLRVLELVLVANQDVLQNSMTLHIHDTDTETMESNKQSSAGMFWPIEQQVYHRQQYQSKDTIRLDRESIAISMFLKSLLSPALSLQGEIIKAFSVMMDYAGRVSNIEEFFETVYKEIVSCLWELLSPLNDHMSDTTFPFMMRLIFEQPLFFQKTVARCFKDQDWEVRFFSLDSVYGLFSKLDDAMVTRLFFRQEGPTTTGATTMNSQHYRHGKGKAVERGHGSTFRHPRQGTMGMDSFEPSQPPHSGAAMNSESPYSSRLVDENPMLKFQNTQQLPIHFSPDHFAILGPAFSYFVSSMWDKEDAVRTKAKTLLKSLQPAHVGHALKAWELYFFSSSAEVQQSQLKLMTRLNNYFPSWRIMDYGLVFKLLTTCGLGRLTDKRNSTSSHLTVSALSDVENLNSSGEDERSSRRGSLAGNVLAPGTSSATAPLTESTLRARRSSLSAINLFENPHSTVISGDGDRPSRREAIDPSAVLEAPFAALALTSEGAVDRSSRSQRRASVISMTKTTSIHESAASVGTGASVPEDAEVTERQLAMEDDLHCGLLNLALQMVANGIEPRLDEVIQLKYLVVFYLDFEGCELLSLGQGKYQVRYGEYIPRHRMSPLQSGLGGDTTSRESSPGMLNDPGHENFVLAICSNLQLILDRFVEIKPDDEQDPPTIYDQAQTRERNGAREDGPNLSSTATRTFTATSSGTSEEIGKVSSRTTTGLHDSSNGQEDEHHHRHHSMFCFPKHKHHSDEHHHDRSGNQSRQGSNDPGQRNQSYTATGSHSQVPRYQQHHHHHYRRNRHRRLDINAPVVGTYFVDVILRFFGSETDLTTLPSSRLKNWLELLLIVVYKYVKEEDPLSDLIVVLMKRIVEMLMVKKEGSSAGRGASNGVNGATPGMMPGLATGGSAGDESMSEENILLAISICSTLLKRSSTMTTALLSREIMAMGKLMTKRREDPEDPVLIRAKNFLHDAFVHFMGNGLFVLVFKTQPAQNVNSFGWVEEPEVDQELDLFYVLTTVLGENEMVPPDPTSGAGKGGPTGTGANNRLVHIRDQPIRDILDRVMIFRDLDPVQVSTILTNLALYVERVHSRFEDPRLLPDMSQFLIKIAKYTAEWDHHQHQKHKDQAQLRQTHDVQQQQQQHLLRQQFKRKASLNNLKSGTNSARDSVAGVGDTAGVMSLMSDATSTTVIQDRAGLGPLDLVPSDQGPTITPTLTTSRSSSSSSPHHPTLQQQRQQSGVSSSAGTIYSDGTGGVGSSKPPPRRKSVALKSKASFDFDHSNPYVQYRRHHHNGGKTTVSSNPTFLFSTNTSSQVQKRGHTPAWDYVNPIMGMCSILMIQNPMDGHVLVPAIKSILRQALYRDKISATSLIRLCTGYTFMAELDFSLALVNVIGEFVVEELKSSITKDAKYGREGGGRYDDHDQDEDELRQGQHPLSFLDRGRIKSNVQDEALEKEDEDKDKKRIKEIKSSGAQNGHHLGLGGVAAHQHQRQPVGGRTKILASNFHILHHLLMWDLDPSYNVEWTRIKWDILGTMRFPPGHPLLFPGANDALRRETALIVGDLVDN